MSSLSMDQVPQLSGLRGLGYNAARRRHYSELPVGMSGIVDSTFGAFLSEPQAPGVRERLKSTTQEGQAEVDRSNASADSLFSSGSSGGPGGGGGGGTIDQRTTNLTMAPMAARAGRVSPLSVSWGMPLQIQPIESRARFGGQGISATKLAMIAGGVIFGGVLLYMIFGGKGDE